MKCLHVTPFVLNKQHIWYERGISEDRVRNKELKYYMIKYVCIFGGRDNFKARGEGSRKTKIFQCVGLLLHRVVICN